MFPLIDAGVSFLVDARARAGLGSGRVLGMRDLRGLERMGGGLLCV